jgi:predicted nucleic acid-binding protein
VIYFDTSALVKLVCAEAETDALRKWIDERRTTNLATSSLARVELVRAVRHEGDAAIRLASVILVELDNVTMTFDLLDAAGALPFPLKTLDAIHLASAMRFRGDLEAFVTYDKQLAAAAHDAGLPVVAPA